MRALVLAAGEGQRLRPLTDRIPKPMLELAGRPILEYNVRLLAQRGIREIAINTHYRPEAIVAHFGDGARFGVSIRYSYEPELLGTAGALLPLRDFFDSTFLVIYGDNVSTCDIDALVRCHREHRDTLATVAVFRRMNATASGVVVFDEDGRVTSFIEKPPVDPAESSWVNAGLLVCEPPIIDLISHRDPSDFGRDLFPRAIGEGRRIMAYQMQRGSLVGGLARGSRAHANRVREASGQRQHLALDVVD